MEESLAMLQESARQGVGIMAATPHFYAEEQSIDQFLQQRQKAWEALNRHMRPDFPKLILGAEVHYFEGICVSPEISKLCLEGTRLLLLEMPFCRWSRRMIRDILDLNCRPDITVLLAHIERYERAQPAGVLDELLLNQVKLQSNAHFFLDWRSRRRAIRLLREGRIHMIGSDCHNMSTRPPNIAQAMQQIQTKLGQQALDEFQQEIGVLVWGKETFAR